MRLTNERFFLWFNKLVFSLLYLRHQGKSVVAIDVNGGARFKVRVNTSDLLIIWEIWKGKIYDDKRIPINDEDVVVDMGAHIGAFAVHAAKLAPYGHVYAYEASRENFALLIENRLINSLNNLDVENSAITNKRGELPFYMPSNNGILGSLLQVKSSNMEMVQAKTFADIVAEHALERIDFLKMDVEGAEFDILLDCADETLAKIQRMVIEYHEFEGDKRSHRDLVDQLSSHGFKVVVEKGIFPQPRWFGTGIIKIGIIKAWRD